METFLTFGHHVSTRCFFFFFFFGNRTFFIEYFYLFFGSIWAYKLLGLCLFFFFVCFISIVLFFNSPLISIQIGDLQCYKYKCEAILKLFQGYRADEVEFCFTFLRHLGWLFRSFSLSSLLRASVTVWECVSQRLAFMCCCGSLKVSRVQTRESLSSFGFPLRLKQK